MKFRNATIATTVVFTVALALGTGLFAQHLASGDRGYFAGPDMTVWLQANNPSETQAYDQALIRAQNLIANHARTIDELIAKRLELSKRPETQNFKGIKFSSLGFTKEFETDVKRATPFSIDTDVAVAFLPDPIVKAVNDAIARSYKSGYKRYGNFTASSGFQLIQQAEIGARGRFLQEDAYQRLAPQLNITGGSIEGDFNRLAAQQEQMFNAARTFYETKAYDKGKLFGGKQRFIKKEFSNSDGEWKGYLELHEQLLDGQLKLIDEARGSARQHIQENAKGVLEAIVAHFRRANAFDHVNNLPTKYREQINRRLRRAYIEGVRDGLRKACNEHLTFVPREYSWTGYQRDYNTGQTVRVRYRATRYTAVWRASWMRPWGGVSYENYLHRTDRVIARFCTWPSVTVKVTDDDEVALAFTVQLPDESFPHTRHVYFRARKGLESDNAFLRFLEAAYDLQYDYYSRFNEDFYYENGWDNTWGTNWSSGKSDWNDNSWNSTSGTQGGSWNDPIPNTTTGGTWNDSPSNTGGSWNDKPQGNTEYNTGSGWNDEPPSNWNNGSTGTTGNTWNDTPAPQPSNDPSNGWNDLGGGNTPSSW